MGDESVPGTICNESEVFGGPTKLWVCELCGQRNEPLVKVCRRCETLRDTEGVAG